jgi:hypothetical protein
MKRLLLFAFLLCPSPNPPPPEPVPVPVPYPVPTPIPTVTATPLPPGPNPMPPPAPIPVPTVWEAIHNDYRCPHGVQPLRWSQALANEAQAWANRCVFQHASNTGHGENLAIGPGLTPERAMELWYEEGEGYPYGVATPPHEMMHFTQMVWAKTSEIGCGTAQCPQGIYHVCRYNPPGNYLGDFARNVPRPTNACEGPYPLPDAD